MVEHNSIIMEAAAALLNHRIATRVRDLRASRKLSLQELSARSGVSRSMISLVERGESSPTAVVLEKLATGLGVMLASLFDGTPDAGAAASPVARRAEQPEWQDPASGYVRRNVTPPAAGHPMHIVEVQFPAGARVAFETGSRAARVHQQVWVLDGAIDVTVGRDRHALREGDCLAMELDRPTMFFNPGRRRARYAVVFAEEPGRPSARSKRPAGGKVRRT
jgi:transcriptional regulator with XRE-family HTH domain